MMCARNVFRGVDMKDWVMQSVSGTNEGCPESWSYSLSPGTVFINIFLPQPRFLTFTAKRKTLQKVSTGLWVLWSVWSNKRADDFHPNLPGHCVNSQTTDPEQRKIHPGWDPPSCREPGLQMSLRTSKQTWIMAQTLSTCSVLWMLAHCPEWWFTLKIWFQLTGHSVTTLGLNKYKMWEDVYGVPLIKWKMSCSRSHQRPAEAPNSSSKLCLDCQGCASKQGWMKAETLPTCPALFHLNAGKTLWWFTPHWG